MYIYGMPVFLDEQVFTNARLGVWQVDEPVEYFLQRLPLTEDESTLISGMREPNRLEWLASRYLLDHICGHPERIDTVTDTHGKPHLVGRPEEISLSHSGTYVAAMLGIRDVGVDIQLCKDKILRLEHKFARPEESERIDRDHALIHLHVLWGAKETLYKIYARKQLHFIRHLHVDLPEHLSDRGAFSGNITISGETIDCILEYHIFKPYVLVYGQSIA